MRNDFRPVSENVALYDRAIKAIDDQGWRRYAYPQVGSAMYFELKRLEATPVKTAVGKGLCLMEAIAVASGQHQSQWDRMAVPDSLMSAVEEACPRIAKQPVCQMIRVTMYNDDHCDGGEGAKRVLRRAIEIELGAK